MDHLGGGLEVGYLGGEGYDKVHKNPLFAFKNMPIISFLMTSYRVIIHQF
jgi:hypothetical protein